jgi:hypothetical protein
MNLVRSLVFLFFVLGASCIMAQTTRDVGAPKPPKPMYRAEKKSDKGILKSLFNKEDKADDETAEFRKRMKSVSKKRRKELRLAEKPQYSDPLYFGHKKPPKRRKNGKKKFCKECGLVH